MRSAPTVPSADSAPTLEARPVRDDRSTTAVAERLEGADHDDAAASVSRARAAQGRQPQRMDSKNAGGTGDPSTAEARLTIVATGRSVRAP